MTYASMSFAKPVRMGAAESMESSTLLRFSVHKVATTPGSSLVAIPSALANHLTKIPPANPSLRCPALRHRIVPGSRNQESGERTPRSTGQAYLAHGLSGSAPFLRGRSNWGLMELHSVPKRAVCGDLPDDPGCPSNLP